MTLAKECEQLSGIPLFQDLDGSKCKLIAMSSERLEFKAGEDIYRAGDPADAVYFMISGRVRLLRMHEGREIELAEVSESRQLGDAGVLCNRPRKMTVRAIDDTVVLRVDAEVFTDLLKQVPQVAIALARQLADIIDQATARLAAQNDPAAMIEVPELKSRN